MEKESSPLLKSSLIYGTYTALISIVISVFVWATSLMETMGIFGRAIFGFISIIISFVIMFIFSRKYRNNEFGGYISFAEAFKFAMMVSIVSIIILAIYNFIFYTFIAPDYMENLYAALQQKMLTFMESRGVPDAAMDQAMERFKEVPTTIQTIKQTLLSGIISGVIVSLIIAAIVQKKVEDSY